MKLEFRPLFAEEIDVRVSQVKENGCSLLLYKDARCDQIILDETVGAMNWQRHHSRDNANCTVSIWDAEKSQWIEKEDTGTESNTEKEKGLASDSFKRACFNWGIGRELYTSPFIWVQAGQCEIKQVGQKYTTYDRFKVTEIDIQNKKIIGLKIINTKTGAVVFSFGSLNASQNAPVMSTGAQENVKCNICGNIIGAAQKGRKMLTGAQIAAQTGGMCLKCYRSEKLKDARDACNGK